MTLGSGTVEIRSGLWHWQVLGGEQVRFLHFTMDGQSDNQMLRPLTSTRAVDDSSVRRLASHPGTRVWVAPDGECWLIHDFSYLARWRRSGPRELTLIAPAGQVHPVEVSDSLELGQMTDDELLELMWRARRGGQAGGSGEASPGDATGKPD